MTREEAVARIKDHIEIHKYHERNAVKIFEALDMAIKALEQPERKKGTWCDVGSLSCRCSECGCKSPKEYSYCPLWKGMIEEGGE